jgi:hypothetical protein
LNLKKWNFWWNNDLVFVARDFLADTNTDILVPDSNVIIVSHNVSFKKKSF